MDPITRPDRLATDQTERGTAAVTRMPRAPGGVLKLDNGGAHGAPDRRTAVRRAGRRRRPGIRSVVRRGDGPRRAQGVRVGETEPR